MDLDATTPFQRLKKNLLFFLQLLILLLCIFALTNPLLWWKDNNFENVVIVVDATGSMSGLGEKEQKLEEAKVKAGELINSLSSSTRMTLVSASRNIKVELSGSTDKKEFVSKLEEIKPTNSAGNIEDSYSLIKAMCDQLQSYKVVYFTDQSINMKELNGEVVEIGTQRPNVSLDYIAEARAGKELKVMIRATNHGSEKVNTEICLYGEEKLISIKNEELKAFETKTVYFDNVPDGSKYIYGELSEDDGLLEDNRIYSVIKQTESKKVLLSTEQNIFLEKALNTLRDIELFKSLPDEEIKEDFDLYILDGDYKGKLPAKGNILFLNPQTNNNFFKVGEEIVGGKAAITTHAVTKYMNNSDFVISNFNLIVMPYWGSPLIKVEEKTAAFAGDFKGQKVAVLGFDIHNSDFPLTMEFPIFINNLISYLVDRDTMTNTTYNCGDSLEITPLPETEKLYIDEPDGKRTEFDSKFPVKTFESTYSTGIYKITQLSGNKQHQKMVSVNFPVSESGPTDTISDINSENENNQAASGKGNNTENSSKNRGGFNLLNLLLLTALIIMGLEWVTYVRQYRI